VVFAEQRGSGPINEVERMSMGNGYAILERSARPNSRLAVMVKIGKTRIKPCVSDE
jgi:hypothetical protein